MGSLFWVLSKSRAVFKTVPNTSNDFDREIERVLVSIKLPMRVLPRNCHIFKDFRFVPFMFADLGLGSQIPLLRTIYYRGV